MASTAYPAAEVRMSQNTGDVTSSHTLITGIDVWLCIRVPVACRICVRFNKLQFHTEHYIFSFPANNGPSKLVLPQPFGTPFNAAWPVPSRTVTSLTAGNLALFASSCRRSASFARAATNVGKSEKQLFGPCVVLRRNSVKIKPKIVRVVVFTARLRGERFNEISLKLVVGYS